MDQRSCAAEIASPSGPPALDTPVSPLSSQASVRSDWSLDYEDVKTSYVSGEGGSAFKTEEVHQSDRRPPRAKKVHQTRHGFNYKPTALKWWFLVTLIGLLVLLVGLVEYSLRGLPNYTQSDDISKLFNLTKSKRDDALRTVDQDPPAVPTVSQGSLSAAVSPTGRFSDSDVLRGNDGYLRRDTPTASSVSGTSIMTSNTSLSPSTSTFLQLSQTTSASIQGVTLTRAGTTSICFSCTPVVSSVASGGYLSIGSVTSTVSVSTTINSSPTTTPTIVATRSSYASQITTVQQTTTLPDITTTTLVTTTNSAGQAMTTGILTVLPGETTVRQTVVTLGPGQSWATTRSFVTVVIGGTPTTEITTLTGTNGRLTTSAFDITRGGITTTIPTSFATILGAIGSPSAEPDPGPGSSTTTTVIVVGITRTAYIIGAFLPTLLAVLITLPLKLININAKLFQPFHALACTRGGATPEASIFLRFYGWPGLLSFPRAFVLRQPVLIASQLLVCGGALLAPIAAEAVAVHVEDGCMGGCAGTLGVAAIPARALEALMGIMVVVLALLLVVLRSFRTGVRQNPWSLAGMAALGLDEEMRTVLSGIPRGLGRKVEDKEVREVLRQWRYGLDQDGSLGFGKGYGVIVRADGVESRRALLKMAFRRSTGRSSDDRLGKRRVMSFCMLTWWGRCLLIFVFLSILVILAYYESTDGNTGFERFMDSQGFGVRFFFTALGVILGFCMATFFRCVAVLSPYLQLSRHPMPPERSILLSPPSNAFYGLFSAFRQRHLYLGLLAFTTILAEFLPVTLAHVPFSLIETWETQVICTWLSISILGLMTLVVAGSFLIRWPHMPVDPRTIAGALFYVCDSWMLGGLEGLSAACKRDRDHIMRGARTRFEFGPMIGMSGAERVGIDIAEPLGGEPQR